jgi:hypothetical protein
MHPSGDRHVSAYRLLHGLNPYLEDIKAISRKGVKTQKKTSFFGLSLRALRLE